MDGNRRNSSIELLRILLMIGVIILHYIADGGHLLENAIEGSSTYYLLVFMNSVCVCAVDTFIIISGYYSCSSNKISFRKIIQLIVQVILFQQLLFIGTSIAKGNEISILSLVYNLVPKNYYVTLYVTLMLLTPFLNFFISKISKGNYKKFLFIIIALFLIEPTAADIYQGFVKKSVYGVSTIGILGSEWGYTIVTFICLYFIAAYVKRYGSIWNTKLNVLIYFISLSILFTWKLIELNNGYSLGAEYYMNPVVVLNALAVFEMFKNYKIESVFINFIARGCFTVYIVHSTLIHCFKITEFINGNVFLFAMHWMGYVFLIFTISDVIGIVYTFVEKIVFNRIQDRFGFYSIEILEKN